MQHFLGIINIGRNCMKLKIRRLTSKPHFLEFLFVCDRTEAYSIYQGPCNTREMNDTHIIAQDSHFLSLSLTPIPNTSIGSSNYPACLVCMCACVCVHACQCHTHKHTATTVLCTNCLPLFHSLDFSGELSSCSSSVHDNWYPKRLCSMWLIRWFFC